MNIRHRPSPAMGQAFAAMVFLAVSCLLLYGADSIHLQGTYRSMEAPDGEVKLEMVLEASSTSPRGATLAIRNRGNRGVSYGAAYGLERYDDGEWTEMKPAAQSNRGWYMVAHLLPPGQEISLNVQWSLIWGLLPDGRYRLSKDFSVEPAVLDEDQSTKDFIKTVEFTISQSDE